MFLLNTIEDHRRKQGQRYDLAHVLLFSIMALLSNADSYRKSTILSILIVKGSMSISVWIGKKLLHIQRSAT
ncbi:MAG: transposase family protein [Candidatus Electrothrix sp. AR1]|nr:transposase family protein [Candidatus Electrothrix sp. AR1]